ncbi:MAG: hypothetical protein J6Q78_05610 [Clostridia bacterium]|nr:hypothetical protein [Clostridia bacterium]
MKKTLSMILALIMIFATVIATLGTVSATGGYGESHPVSGGEISWIGNEPKPYLYAYYSDKVVLDGYATQNGADGKPGDMGAEKEYDSDYGSGEDHYIEYVFDTVNGVKIAATWNDTTDVLYLAVPATVTELAIEIGGKTLDIDCATPTVAGIVGAQVKKGDIYEIAIPMNKTLELDYDGMYVVTDIKVTTNAGTFDGKLAFTSMVPVIIAAGDDNYRAKNIKTPDDIKLTTISETGRNYRHWMLATDEVEDGYKLRATYTDEELAAKNGGDARAGLLIYCFDPMYGDVPDAETYVLKADVKIEGLPQVPEAAIASSRDIGTSGLKYDTTMPHVTFYVSNNTNAMGAIMNCGAIFNTEKGLQMVISTFVGNGTVIDLGKNVGDEFELKIINNVVTYDSDTKMIDKSENYVFEVYVDDVKVGEAVNKQVKGSKICEYGFGFNVISNMQGAAKVEGAYRGITVEDYQWKEGGLTIANFVSSYEKTYDIEALAALSVNDLEVKATNRFLKQDVVTPPVITPPVVTPPDDVMIATLNDIDFDGDLAIEKAILHTTDENNNVTALGTPHLAEYCIDVTLENGALGAAYSLEKKELYIGIYALEEVYTVDITVGGTDYTVDVAFGYVDGGESGGRVVASGSDYTYEIIIPLDEIAIRKVARGVGTDISITVDSLSGIVDTFEGQLLFSKYAAGFTYNQVNQAASMLLHEQQATDNGDGTVTLVNDGTEKRVYDIMTWVPNITKDLVLKFDLTVDSMPYSTIEDVANDSPSTLMQVAAPRLWFALRYRFSETLYMNIQNTADDGLVLNVYEYVKENNADVKKQHTIILGKETGEKMVLEFEWSEENYYGKCPLKVYVDGALVGSVENAMNIDSGLGRTFSYIMLNAQWTKTDISNDTIDVTWGNISVNEISDLYDEDAYNAMCNNLVNKPTIPDNDFDDITPPVITPPDISIKDEDIDGNNKPGIGGIIGDLIGGQDKEDGDKNNNNSNSNNNDKNKNDISDEEVMVIPMGGCFSSISGISALAVISSALIATVLGKKKREE